MTSLRVCLADLAGRAGTHLGTGDWAPVRQEQIDAFAEATGDRHWIHVDRERAAAGPFGAPVAHGFLTVSLIPGLLRSVYRLEDASLVVNYGLNRVRFPAPVRAGSLVRAAVDLLEVRPVAGGHQLSLRIVVELAGSAKPACVAESIVRAFP